MANNLENTDFNDILDHWQEQGKGRYRWEGDSGVRNFEQLVKDIGYDQGIENFLADNPGAIETLLEWISDHAEKGGIEWKINLADNCDYQEETEEDEEDNNPIKDDTIEDMIKYALLIGPKTHQRRIICQIKAELEANDADSEETYQNWEHQSKSQLMNLIEEILGENRPQVPIKEIFTKLGI